ncbi:MAG: CBS domain-containing protein [Chitinophagaceae bacterium]|jgi:CBS domain-containing protein|nr:CBS domain-containing protein [Chitinophagaceae bacterium]
MPIIKDLLLSKNRKLITVSSTASIFDALKIMAEANIGCLIVLEGDNYVGMFTERDYARKIVLEGRSSDTTTVNEIMISDIPKLNSNDTIELCSKIMTEKTVRYLPIFENNQLVNLISQSDIIKYTIDSQKSLIEHLQDYMNLK